MRLRVAAYETSATSNRKRLNSIVISIGNITLGGTGKTPFAEYIARYLEQGRPRGCDSNKRVLAAFQWQKSALNVSGFHGWTAANALPEALHTSNDARGAARPARKRAPTRHAGSPPAKRARRERSRPASLATNRSIAGTCALPDAYR